MMKLRFASPAHLVDINRDPGPRRRSRSATASCASARWSATTRSPTSDVITRGYPTIAAAAPQIADPLVRNLGHDRRLARPRGPGGRLGLGDARDGRHAWCSKRTAGERDGPDRRVPRRHVHHLDRSRTSSSTEIRVPTPPAAIGRHLPEARAQGGRLRHGRRSPCALSLANGSIGRGGHRPHRRRARRTSRRPTPRQSLAGAEPTDEAFAEAGRLAAAASRPRERRARERDVQAAHGRGLRATRARAARRAGRDRELREETDMQITVTVNGTEHTVDVEPRELLVHLIRERRCGSPARTSGATPPAAAPARCCSTARR